MAARENDLGVQQGSENEKSHLILPPKLKVFLRRTLAGPPPSILAPLFLLPIFLLLPPVLLLVLLLLLLLEGLEGEENGLRDHHK